MPPERSEVCRRTSARGVGHFQRTAPRLHVTTTGEELFVCDYGNDRLQVFSLAGEHRRSIAGE